MKLPGRIERLIKQWEVDGILELPVFISSDEPIDIDPSEYGKTYDPLDEFPEFTRQDHVGWRLFKRLGTKPGKSSDRNGH